MTMEDVTNFMDHKIEQNPNEIVISFYEVRVKMNLSEEETKILLFLCKTRLEKFGYKIYLTGQKFIHNNVKRTVEPNELLVAVKVKKTK